MDKNREEGIKTLKNTLAFIMTLLIIIIQVLIAVIYNSKHVIGLPQRNEAARKRPCRNGSFQDKNNNKCVPLLKCDEIDSLEVVRQLEGGFVKKISLVRWGGMDLVYSTPRVAEYEEDFASGMKILKKMHDSTFLVELVGICHEPKQILTHYYKHGSANQVSNVIKQNNFNESQEFEIRLQITSDYLQIINFLHNNPTGCRVMCDSNDLEKTLSQFLITDDFHLVLADVDALPLVDKAARILIKCGHRQLFGTFVAPEQLWPFQDVEFHDEKMLEYDEKTDIWKIPDVVYHLLGNSVTADKLKFRLFNILKQCKSRKPNERPSVSEIVSLFEAERRKILNQRNIHFPGEL